MLEDVDEDEIEAALFEDVSEDEEIEEQHDRDWEGSESNSEFEDSDFDVYSK